ncbi:hypothetical protein M5E06_17760 [Azospirillum sp. A1-3]|uniref:hypothetical protein n=1 Tax=Azospirillum sp. A1-3 TaxID=185874 RepID=UPI0020774801|nr:hypothetical protein [Azospirillum sp. A1-3]MCM8735982.1 hypothetical protein [Azospirillum sp. A1-3]
MTVSEFALIVTAKVAWFCGWVLSFTIGGVVGVVILKTIDQSEPTSQIVGAIVFAGCLIAAAVWFKKPAQLKVYGNDWRISEGKEADRG